MLGVTVCLRTGLRKPLPLPKVGRDQGGAPQGGPGAAELHPHLPFLESRLSQPHSPGMRRRQLRKFTSPVQGPESRRKSHICAWGSGLLFQCSSHASQVWPPDRGENGNSKLTKQIRLGCGGGTWRGRWGGGKGGRSAAVPAGCGADELGHLLHVVCGQQHHLLIL